MFFWFDFFCGAFLAPKNGCCFSLIEAPSCFTQLIFQGTSLCQPWGHQSYCWRFRNLANQLRLVVYSIIYRVMYIPDGCLGFPPSTVTSMILQQVKSTQTNMNVRMVALCVCFFRQNKCKKSEANLGIDSPNLWKHLDIWHAGLQFQFLAFG